MRPTIIPRRGGVQFARFNPKIWTLLDNELMVLPALRIELLDTGRRGRASTRSPPPWRGRDCALPRDARRDSSWYVCGASVLSHVTHTSFGRKNASACARARVRLRARMYSTRAVRASLPRACRVLAWFEPFVLVPLYLARAAFNAESGANRARG